jgi:hypothetical protein
MDNLKNRWRPATASAADPTRKPAQSERLRSRRRRSERREDLGDFVRKLVDLANCNEALMDGTMEPIKRIIAEGDVVFAVWQDPEAEYGVDCLGLKGEKLLKEIEASQNAQVAQITAVKCICKEQAIALKQVLGDRDHDA